MIERIKNAWALAKSSWQVLQQDRELAWLPVVGAIGALLVGAMFFGPAAVLFGGAESDTVPAATYLFGFLGYVAVSAVIFWSRAAVVHGANERMEGGDPTVGSALRGASGHFSAVVVFAAISVTVGLILDAIEDQGVLGAIASFIGGAAWRVLTYLVMPVIVLERVGAIEGIKQSSALVKRTWGEQVSGNVGFGLLQIGLTLPAILVVMVLAPLGATFAFVSIVAAVIWAITVAVVITTLSGIFQTALYRQATGRSVPGAFDQRLLAQAITPR